MAPRRAYTGSSRAPQPVRRDELEGDAGLERRRDLPRVASRRETERSPGFATSSIGPRARRASAAPTESTPGSSGCPRCGRSAAVSRAPWPSTSRRNRGEDRRRGGRSPRSARRRPLAILKARGRPGSLRPVSIALTVWRETPRRAARTACDQSRSARRTRRRFFTFAPLGISECNVYFTLCKWIVTCSSLD